MVFSFSSVFRRNNLEREKSNNFSLFGSKLSSENFILLTDSVSASRQSARDFSCDLIPSSSLNYELLFGESCCGRLLRRNFLRLSKSIDVSHRQVSEKIYEFKSFQENELKCKSSQGLHLR